MPTALVIGMGFAFNMTVLWRVAFDDAIRQMAQTAQRFLPV